MPDIDFIVPGISDPSVLKAGERVRLRRIMEKKAVKQLRGLGYSYRQAERAAVSAVSRWKGGCLRCNRML